MLDLKLAQYSAEGKFEKFLELGKDFVYGGDYILIDGKLNKINEKWLSCPTCLRSYGVTTPITIQEHYFKGEALYSFIISDKDEKDPFNRFNGLFDGRTYGGGRFVLMKSFIAYDDYCRATEDDFVEGNFKLGMRPENYKTLGLIVWRDGYKFQIEYLDGLDVRYWSIGNPFEIIGNLHENPELWEKIK